MLTGDRLSVLTSAGVVHEFNALTGATVWVAPIGNPDFPSLGPAANKDYVALVNGATLYVLNQKDGRPVIVRDVGGAPGAAPTLSATTCFVPLVSGRMEGYPVRPEQQKATPWYYQSHGRAMVAPIATEESIVWTTDAGYLYVGNTETLKMRFRLETPSEIVSSPAYRKPYVYVASLAGNVFGMHEVTGIRRWKYASGYPITRSPAAVGERVYATSEEPALHCIDAKTGAAIWEVGGIEQFAAASKDRVYAVNDLGGLVVLDAATGAEVARTRGQSSLHALVNDQTDRIYVISQDGVVQCFHEINATTPLYHNAPTEEKTIAPTTTQPSDATSSRAPASEEPAEDAPAGFGDEPALDQPADGETEPAEMNEFGIEADSFEGVQ
jgi:outer membrane protein assembly factor BamB